MTPAKHPPDELLFALGEGQLNISESQRVKAHCDGCAACEKRLRSYGSLIHRLAPEAPPAPSGLLERAVSDSLRRKDPAGGTDRRNVRNTKETTMENGTHVPVARPPLTSTRRWTWKWAAALVAVLLLGGSTGMLYTEMKSGQNGGEQDRTNKQRRIDAINAVSMSHLRQLGIGVFMYADSHKTLPPMKTPEEAQAALEPFLGNSDFFLQPDVNEPYRPNAALSGMPREEIRADPASVYVYSEAVPAKDGSRGVVFLNGSASRVSAEEWKRLASTL